MYFHPLYSKGSHDHWQLKYEMSIILMFCYCLWFFSLPVLSARLTVLHIFNCSFYVHGHSFQLLTSSKQQDFYHHNWWAPRREPCMFWISGGYSGLLISDFSVSIHVMVNILEEFVYELKKKMNIEILFYFFG